VKIPAGSERERGYVRHLVLQWHITERCNYRCSHCYQESYDGEELSFAEMVGVLGQFKELVERQNAEDRPFRTRGDVRITGGEPFVRKDCLQFLEVLSENRNWLRFGVLTNGSYVDESMARRLRELGTAFVQVSVEGAKETNDRIRGEGAYDRAAAALVNLVRQGIRSLISFTAQRGNFHEFKDVAELGRRLGVSRVWSDRLIPFGTGAAMRQEMLSPEETRRFFEIMFEARTEAGRSFCRTDISMCRALQFLVGGGEPYHCAAGDDLLTLQPDGDVYPCRRMPIRVGNAREESLTEIYYGAELLRELRDRSRVADGCEDCRYAQRCGGGLRCLSYAVFGDPFRADPGCWHARSRSELASSVSSAD